MLRTAAVIGMLLSLGPVACATTVQAGLANAPGLSGTLADPRVHDAIANGTDSCEPAPGALRNEVPPCPIARPESNPTVAIQPPSAKRDVVPWVEHYYTPWACFSQDDQVGRVTLAGSFASPPLTSGRTFLGACAPWDGKR
jgi:hypothetical protein